MTVPEPAATAGMHRLNGDLWFGVVNDCSHTIGSDPMHVVQSELEQHFKTCPDIKANQ